MERATARRRQRRAGCRRPRTGRRLRRAAAADSERRVEPAPPCAATACVRAYVRVLICFVRAHD